MITFWAVVLDSLEVVGRNHGSQVESTGETPNIFYKIKTLDVYVIPAGAHVTCDLSFIT